jgi:hypothetical protein
MDGDGFTTFEKLLLAASPSKGRRSSLGSLKRLSSVQVPESHPVSPEATSPVSSDARPDGGVHSPQLAQSGRRKMTSPAISHFSIPAYHGALGGNGHDACQPAAAARAAATPSPHQLAAPTPKEEHVTLNMFVQDPPAAEEVEGLHAELAAMRSCVSLLHIQLQEAQQAAQQQLQQSAAAQVATAEHAKLHAKADAPVKLVINVLDGACAASPLLNEAAAQVPHEAEPATQPIQVVFQVQELPHAEQNGAAAQEQAAEASDGDAINPVVLRQQLLRVEACREELGRQAGQLRARVAKVGVGPAGPVLAAGRAARSKDRNASAPQPAFLADPGSAALLPPAGGSCASRGGAGEGAGWGARGPQGYQKGTGGPAGVGQGM